MAGTVIEINNLSKQYRLGQISAKYLADDFKRWLHRIRGKEDPFLQMGDENDRTKKSISEYVWAIKNINFSVEQGDVFGIIGKNGAGKSTLLKILSRTTAPTTGEYKIRGRVASLLEVGTGFHPDLSGRENVYLNGAILGMTKAEIKKNFDEIVAFSGVERYIDTPVKRYSSGMYVRLAFAVAAHLEPEILIVDEVLAVGDAEFQKKCLGKMQDVSKKGRTVLLVTHNLTVIRNLCNKTLYLKNGVTASIGETSKVIDEYLIEDQISTDNGLIPEDASIYNNGDAKFLTFNVLNLENKTVDSLYFEQDFIVELTLKVNRLIEKAVIDLSIGSLDTRYTYTSTFDSQNTYLHLEEGVHQIRLQASPRVIPGAYTFYLGIHDYGKNGLTLDFIEKIGVVNVLQFREKSGEKFHLNASLGNVIVKGNWEINKL